MALGVPVDTQGKQTDPVFLAVHREPAHVGQVLEYLDTLLAVLVIQWLGKKPDEIRRLSQHGLCKSLKHDAEKLWIMGFDASSIRRLTNKLSVPITLEGPASVVGHSHLCVLQGLDRAFRRVQLGVLPPDISVHDMSACLGLRQRVVKRPEVDGPVHELRDLVSK